MRVRLLASLLTSSFLVTAPVAACQQAPSLVREAKGESFEIKSAILGETRRIFVTLPASFEKTTAPRTYPVIVVVDGEALTSPVSSVASHLSGAGQMPESIIVGIENTDRLRDLTPPGLSVSGSSLNEGGDRFIDFIEKELLPAVDRQFRGGLPRTFVGHSSGGILATYIAATRNSFRTVVAIDTPVHLGDNWLAEKMMKRASASGTPAVRYVSLEARFGWSDVRWKAFAEAVPSSWRIYREKLAHESHESMTMLASYLGLREAYADYSILAAPKSPTTSILPSYDKLSASLGTTVIPPRRLLATTVEDLVAEGRGAEARKAFTTLVTSYGSPANASELDTQIAKAERQPPPTVTVESLLATPFSTPVEAARYVGEWVGDIWMNPDEPRNGRQTLRIRVVDGKITGETVHHLPDGETMIEPWTYFRVTKTGMTYGYMNGMRPRGMLLHEGTLKGDTLTGEMKFGGVNFTRPDGEKPPTIYFAYRKVK